MSDFNQQLGKRGEKLALQFIKKKGYTILAQNYRLRCGEIDIIAQEGEVLVFLEVKTRKSHNFGSPFAAITQKKQKQISKVALEYLQQNSLFDKEARFDVVAVTWHQKESPEIELLQNAFELNYGF